MLPPPCSQVKLPRAPRPPTDLAPDCGPTPTGFLVLHVEAEQRPQVDLEQLLAGEP